ncbi:MAG: LysR family transcriptional regulator [Bacteroidales bacterium]|nr:LysR family transcriptional regulator [Bacteroidales bacterium]
MIDDFRLKVFMTVAAEGSFTKAAAVLGITQPAVSQNISELEKNCGRKLFERLRTEVVLTSQGRVFKEYAQKVQDSYASLDFMFASLQPASVRIAVSDEIYSLLVAPAVESFIVMHPEIIVERALFDDADLTIALKPASDRPFDVPSDSISRIRISSGMPTKTGDFKATREKVSYYDLLYQPSPSFACTRLCRMLRDHLLTFL